MQKYRKGPVSDNYRLPKTQLGEQIPNNKTFQIGGDAKQHVEVG